MRMKVTIYTIYLYNLYTYIYVHIPSYTQYIRMVIKSKRMSDISCLFHILFERGMNKEYKSHVFPLVILYYAFSMILSWSVGWYV